MNPIITNLSGVTYGDAQKNIKSLGGPGIGNYFLIREHNNPHDPNAIRVAYIGEYFMGYVPKQIAKTLAPMMDAGMSVEAEFFKLNKSPVHKIVGIKVRIVETNCQEQADN